MHNHAQPPRESDPGYSVSGDEPVRAPLRVWIALAGVLLVTGGALARVEFNRSADANRVQRLEDELREFRNVVRELRDASIAIRAKADEFQRQTDRLQQQLDRMQK